MFLFIFEGLGTSELLMILIVALVIFGPRKLPQLSRSLGKSLADFRRASEDFKQTWEKEVERETSFAKDALLGGIMPDEDRSILGPAHERAGAVLEGAELSDAATAPETQADINPLWPSADASAVARGSSSAAAAPTPAAPEPPAAQAQEPSRKRDWL